MDIDDYVEDFSSNESEPEEEIEIEAGEIIESESEPPSHDRIDWNLTMNQTRNLLREGKSISGLTLVVQLIKAARDNEFSIVEMLINYGLQCSDSSIFDNYEASIYGSALQIASKKGLLRMVDFLLEHGADVDQPDNIGSTSLIMAAENGKEEIVQRLIDHGANVNALNYGCCSGLYYASDYGYFNIVKLLLENNAMVNYQGGWNDISPLMRAAEKGHLEITRYLIQYRANMNARDKVGDNALIKATLAGHNEIVKLLVECNPHSLHITNQYGETPLLVALATGRWDIAKYLLSKGASVSPMTDPTTINDILLLNSLRGELHIVKFLVSHGADVNLVDKSPARLYASFAGHIPNLKRLLYSQDHLEENMTRGSYPIILAAKAGCFKIVRYLIEVGADIYVKDMYGMTSLMIGAKGGHLQVVKFFIEEGDEEDIYQIDVNGRTPLLHAAWGGHLHVVKYLVGLGADINMRDNLNRSIFYETPYKNRELIKFLAQNGADPNPDGLYKANISPLIQAAQEGDLEIVKAFFDKGNSQYLQRTYLHAFNNNQHHVKDYIASITSSLAPTECKAPEDYCML